MTHKRLLLLGDTHANTLWVMKAIDKAKQLECDAVFQLGDLGFWPREPFGRKFLRKVSEHATKGGMPVYWLDGNHEDHEAIPRWLEKRGPEFVPSVFYVPRATAWEWSGVRILALGGAVSIDRQYRTPGRDWFFNEAISIAEAEEAVAVGKVDVLLTHDSSIRPPGFRSGWKDDPMSTENVRIVNEVRREVRPRLHVHGHWHRCYETMNEYITRVVGLDCDKSGQSMAVLDLEALAAGNPRYLQYPVDSGDG